MKHKLKPKTAYNRPCINEKIFFIFYTCWRTRLGSVEVLLAESEDSIALRFGIIKRRIFV